MRLVRVGFDFLVDDDTTQEQIDAVIADAFAQIDDAPGIPTGEVFISTHVSRPGFPGKVG